MRGVFATVNRLMADIRAGRALLVAAIVALLAAVPAWASSGGAPIGAPTPPASHHHSRRRTGHHPRRHPAAHHRRAHRSPPHRRRRSRRSANPLHGRAMWIWELPNSSGGDLASIIAGAHQYRITTLIIKSSDGSDPWSQFTPRLVSELHAAHLKVCAWQYVYGDHPGVEANLGADAAKDGADCLIVDAESEYEGRYVAAQAYVHDLRKQVGPRYLVALAGFPYVDYHPGFPYSVFLGPGGAQADAPQMYWRAIGTSVASVFAHTYAFNLPYGRPIYPLGQVYGNPPMRQIMRFRELALGDGAGGVSWWDWQEAATRDWDALSKTTGPLPEAVRTPVMGAVARGADGDLVVWIQEHLLSAGYPVAIDGAFGHRTRTEVQAFQTAHGLTDDGIVGPATWAALLRYRPADVHWVHDGRRTIATDALSPRAAPVTGGAPLTLPVPASASRPARGDEIPGNLGAGP